MIDDLVNNLEVDFLECSDRLINFALPVEFDQYLVLPRPGNRIWEEREYKRSITKQPVIQPPEHLPQNGPAGQRNENQPDFRNVKCFVCGERFTIAPLEAELSSPALRYTVYYIVNSHTFWLDSSKEARIYCILRDPIENIEYNQSGAPLRL